MVEHSIDMLSERRSTGKAPLTRFRLMGRSLFACGRDTVWTLRGYRQMGDGRSVYYSLPIAREKAVDYRTSNLLRKLTRLNNPVPKNKRDDGSGTEVEVGLKIKSSQPIPFVSVTL